VADQLARHVERPLRCESHGGCGGRAGETYREQSRQGAPVRPSLRHEALLVFGWG